MGFAEKNTIAPCQPESVGPDVIGVDDSLNNEVYHCHSSSISESSKNVFSSDNKKAKNNKKKKIDTSRYLFNFHKVERFNDYLQYKNSESIRDIIINQKQYHLFFSNINTIFENLFSDFEFIVNYLYNLSYNQRKNYIIDLFVSILTINKFNIFKYLITNINFKFSQDEQNLLWIHCCGLGNEDYLYELLSIDINYKYTRSYLKDTTIKNSDDFEIMISTGQYFKPEYTFLRKIEKVEDLNYEIFDKGVNFTDDYLYGTLLYQIIDYYPNFYNYEILEYLKGCDFLNMNYHNIWNCKKIQYILKKSTNFKLLDYFLEIDNDYNNGYFNYYSINNLVEKILYFNNFDYIDYILNHSSYSEIKNKLLETITHIDNIDKYNLYGKTPNYKYSIDYDFYNNEYVYDCVQESGKFKLSSGKIKCNCKSKLCILNEHYSIENNAIFSSDKSFKNKVINYNVYTHTYITKEYEIGNKMLSVICKYYLTEFLNIINEQIQFNEEDDISTTINKLDNLERLKNWFKSNYTNNNSIYKFKYMEPDDFQYFIIDFPYLSFILNVNTEIFFKEHLINYINSIENLLPSLPSDVLNIILSY